LIERYQHFRGTYCSYLFKYLARIRPVFQTLLRLMLV